VNIWVTGGNMPNDRFKALLHKTLSDDFFCGEARLVAENFLDFADQIDI